MSTCGYQEGARAEAFQSASSPLLHRCENTIFASGGVDVLSDGFHGRSDQSDVVHRPSKDKPNNSRDASPIHKVEIESQEPSKIRTRRCSLGPIESSTSNHLSTNISISNSQHLLANAAGTDLQDVRYGRIDLLSPWFPEVNPDHQRSQTWRNWLSRQDVLLSTATVSCLIVFVVNLVITVFVQAKFKASGSILTLFEGGCSRVKSNDTIYHVLINVLSTILLGASNLSMQLLAAPTRREVDKAHSEGKWLDIGVPSWRNLRSISRIRQLIWWCLVLSSIPLHFIYNSAISVSLPAHGYAGAVVSESFLRGAPWGDASSAIFKSVSWPPKEKFDAVAVLEDMQTTALDGKSLVNRSKWDCLEVYSDIYGDRSNLLLVTRDAHDSDNASLIQYEYQPVSRYEGDLNWPCWDTPAIIPECLRPETMSSVDIDRWTKSGREVLYCMSQKRAKELCRLNYSPAIMIVICCVSGFKCLCIILAAYLFQKHREVTLRTIGDAISSFLEVHDPYTAKLGIVTKNLLGHRHVWRPTSLMLWQPRKIRWYVAASTRRWIFTTTICFGAIIAAAIILTVGARGTMKRTGTSSLSSILSLGFGTANPRAFTAYFLPHQGTKGFIANILFANYWQMVLSCVYLAYNALLTCQLVSEEWSGYARERKTLRVSHPRGIQRSSYFVSMPFKYGISLMAANATLHWLVSQSMFLVSTTAYFPNDIEDISGSFTTTGYSTSASLAAVCVGTFMLVAILINGFRTFPPGMPLVGSCSVAISAACQRPLEDNDAHLLPVQWGVITSAGEHPARCSFTTLRTVEPPKEGELLLGLASPPEKTRRQSRRRWWFNITGSFERGHVVKKKS